MWELCFGDAPDVAESFLCISDIITLEERDGDTLIGMASLVPVRTKNALSGYYAYGVCTHPDHRGRGVFTRLMDNCEATAKRAGADFICLIPATERLADTYAHMGYSKKISLFDTPVKKGDAIFSKSLGFREFATPDSDTAPIFTVNFGMIKPLSAKVKDLDFYFAEPMGER